MAELCKNCGGTVKLIQAHHPAKARCPACGHEVDFLWDPLPPLDPHSDADGLIVVDSFSRGNAPVN